MSTSEDPRWKQTRAGARAGRGFRYQDAAAAFLLVEQWSQGTTSKLVPEGLDDLNLFVDGVETRIQAKSMHDPKGMFRTLELAEYLEKTAALLSQEEWVQGSVRIAVILERPVIGLEAKGWEVPLSSYEDVALVRQALETRPPSARSFTVEQLLERSFLLVNSTPIECCVQLLNQKQGAPAFACRLVAQQLRVDAGRCSDENYLAKVSNAASMTTADVTGVMERVLVATQEGGLQRAIQDGICEFVDFSIKVHDEAFYAGVNVVAGHVAAGLVFERPAVNEQVETTVESGKATLIAGQSGSGKSACAWLYANSTRHDVIWYKVARLAPGESALLLRLAKANEASRTRRVGFILDDVGRNFADTWDEVVRMTGESEGVILIGTIREEDLDLLEDLRSTTVVRPQLDEELATRLFTQLSPAETRHFHHWREPFEESKGLLLEFTHLVTQGQRLEAVLRDQLRQRVKEARDDELLILQAVSFASRFSAAIDKKRLREKTGLTSIAFARALNRLVQEHAVALIGDNSISGLHEIRSRHLDILLREITHQTEASSLHLALTCIRFKDLASFIAGLYRELPTVHDAVVQELVSFLPGSKIEAWTAAFHGLGLVTCDLVGKSWMEICKDEKINERFAHTVFGLAIVNANLEGMDFWERIRGAMSRFSGIGIPDKRLELSMQLSSSPPLPSWSLQQAVELAAALMPLYGTTQPPATPQWLVTNPLSEPASASQVLGFINVLRELSEQLAAEALTAQGGSAHLLEKLHSDTAWLTKPTLENSGDGVSIIRANIRVVNDAVQSNLHECAVSICNMLIAAEPVAQAATVSAVLGDGSVFKVGDYPVADVRLDRKGIVVPARVAWNRAQLRSIQQAQETGGETARANSLAISLSDTFSILRRAAECFCRLETAPSKLHAFASIRQVLAEMILPGRVRSPVAGVLDIGNYDTSDIVIDMVQGIQEITADLMSGKVERPLLRAINTMKISSKMGAVASSQLWRYTDLASDIDFEGAAQLLKEISYVLADMHTCPSESHSSRAALSKRSRKHSALGAASAQALSRAQGLIEARRRELEVQFQRVEPGSVVVARNDPFEHQWPPASFAILLPCNGIVEFFQAIDHFASESTWDGPDHRVAAPLLRGKIAARFAMGGVSTVFPQFKFTEEWKALLPYPLLNDVATAEFDRVFTDCTNISAVMTGLDRILNSEEEDYLNELLEPLAGRVENFLMLSKGNDDEVIVAAGAFLVECAQKAIGQVQKNGAGPSIAQDQASLFRNEINDSNAQVLGYRLLLADWDAASQPVQGN